MDNGLWCPPLRDCIVLSATWSYTVVDRRVRPVAQVIVKELPRPLQRGPSVIRSMACTRPNCATVVRRQRFRLVDYILESEWRAPFKISCLYTKTGNSSLFNMALLRGSSSASVTSPPWLNHLVNVRKRGWVRLDRCWVSSFLNHYLVMTLWLLSDDVLVITPSQCQKLWGWGSRNSSAPCTPGRAV